MINDLLLWSINARDYEHTSHLDNADFNKLLKLLIKHKVLINFYKKASKLKPPWLSESQLLITWIIYEKQNIKIEAILSALTEIDKYAKNKHINYVVFKGLTTYLLTGDSTYIKSSSDIDILCDNEQELVLLLNELGYTEVDKNYPDHEYVSMRYGEVEFDIHKYIPIERYHPNIKKNLEDLECSRTWFVSEKDIYLTKNLQYTNIDILFSKNIVVPSITMHAFIMCLNVFRNYYHAFYNDALTLFDWFEIKAIIAHPQFDRNQFIELTEEYSAWDAIEFTSIFLDYLFGLTLCNLGVEKNFKQYPFKLTWSGVWAVPSVIECLLSRSFDDVNYQLLPAVGQGKFAEVELKGFNSHILYYLKKLEISKSKDHYSIDITVPLMTWSLNDYFSLKISTDSNYEWSYGFGNMEELYLIDQIKISTTMESDQYTIIIKIPLFILKSDTIVLCINRWGGSGVLVTYIPILLREDLD